MKILVVSDDPSNAVREALDDGAVLFPASISEFLDDGDVPDDVIAYKHLLSESDAVIFDLDETQDFEKLVEWGSYGHDSFSGLYSATILRNGEHTDGPSVENRSLSELLDSSQRTENEEREQIVSTNAIDIVREVHTKLTRRSADYVNAIA